jgi:putative transcriptional regulator
MAASLLTSATAYVIECSTMSEAAETIRQFRASKGWSQEYLARLVGVSLNTVQRWESGKTVPSPLAMNRLREVLGDTLEDKQPRLL